jgi:hypothetical protein
MLYEEYHSAENDRGMRNLEVSAVTAYTYGWDELL